MKSAAPARAVIFDFNRTLFDPTVYALYNGAQPMLQELSAHKRLFLYSRKAWDRSGLLTKLGIDTLFEAVYFVSEKTKENLAEILAAHELTPESTIMVGDMLEDEICVGAELGLITVWLRQSMFAQSADAKPVCVPTYTVDSIEALRDLLAML